MQRSAVKSKAMQNNRLTVSRLQNAWRSILPARRAVSNLATIRELYYPLALPNDGAVNARFADHAK
jgi:hypothetical protein